MISFDMSSPHGPSLRFACAVYIYTNYHYEPHSHFYNELVLIQRGRLRVRIADAEYMLCPGDVIVYPAHVDHEEWAEGGKPVLSWACGFLWDTIGSGSLIHCHDTDGQIQELIAWLVRECYARKPLGEDRSFGLPMLHAILTELGRLSFHEPDAMVDKVRAFVREHFQDAFTLEDLSAVAGLSKSHFVRQYRSVTGRTPMEDARLLRVEEARRLIITTPLPLSEIAPLVGIRNEFHLSRLLKTLLGVGVRDLRP